MAAKPSIAARTVILIGVENRDANGDLQIRTAAFDEIPIENAFNPTQPRTRRTGRNRAKNGLDPDGFTMGASSYAIQGEYLIEGSGIANRPPSWMRLMSGMGWKEVRLASINNADAPAATAAGSAAGGSDVDVGLAAGDYSYGYTILYEDDGTTEAATLAAGAFESLMAKVADTLTIVTPGNTGAVSSLPSAGIKFIYRTTVDNDASTDPADYQYVGTVADGATTFRDSISDVNLGQRAPLSRSAPTASSTATTSAAAGGALANATKYDYKSTILLDADGVPVTDANNAVYESEPSAAFTGTTGASDEVLDIADLQSTGVKRLYRSDGYTGGGPGVNFKFVTTVASGTTTHSDGLAPSSRGGALVDGADCAIFVPVSEYADFGALTVQSYLDSRNYPAKSARGGFDWGGTFGETVTARFTLEGVYNTSVKVANPDSEFDEPGDPPQLCNADLVLAPEGGDERDPIWQSFGFSVPRTPAPRGNANAPCANKAIMEYVIGQRVDPRLTLTIELPNEVGTAADTDWIGDAVTGRYFGFRFHIGNDARAQITVTNDAPWGDRRYLAQVAEDPDITTDESTGHRIVNLNLQLTGRTGIRDSFARIIHGTV